MTSATDELRRMLDERGVRWMPSVWSAKDETFYKVGEVGYLATELSSGRMKVCIEGYPTPEQAIDATLGRGTCRRVLYKPTDVLVCSKCGAGMPRQLDKYCYLHYCPNCGARVVSE